MEKTAKELLILKRKCSKKLVPGACYLMSGQQRWEWLTYFNVSNCFHFITCEVFQLFQHCYRRKNRRSGVKSTGSKCQARHLGYFPEIATPSLPTTSTGELYFPASWFWAWPRDLFWPMENWQTWLLHRCPGKSLVGGRRDGMGPEPAAACCLQSAGPSSWSADTRENKRPLL